MFFLQRAAHVLSYPPPNDAAIMIQPTIPAPIQSVERSNSADFTADSLAGSVALDVGLVITGETRTCYGDGRY